MNIAASGGDGGGRKNNWLIITSESGIEGGEGAKGRLSKNFMATRGRSKMSSTNWLRLDLKVSLDDGGA